MKKNYTKPSLAHITVTLREMISVKCVEEFGLVWGGPNIFSEQHFIQYSGCAVWGRIDHNGDS